MKSFLGCGKVKRQKRKFQNESTRMTKDKILLLKKRKNRKKEKTQRTISPFEKRKGETNEKHRFFILKESM